MKYKKDNQRETLIVEICAWVLLISIVYLFVKVIS